MEWSACVRATPLKHAARQTGNQGEEVERVRERVSGMLEKCATREGVADGSARRPPQARQRTSADLHRGFFVGGTLGHYSQPHEASEEFVCVRAFGETLLSRLSPLFSPATGEGGRWAGGKR